MMRIASAVSVVFLLFCTSAFACQFDTDCEVGSKCVKKRNALYGVCLDGLSPGNSNDQEPVYDPLDPNETTGDTCQFDTDCGPGSVCVKGKNKIYGACLRKMDTSVGEGVGMLVVTFLRDIVAKFNRA
jgi:hypothetical protein